MNLSKTDRTLVARYIDDELDAQERAQFEQRLASDLTLSSAVTDARSHRDLLRAADPVASGPVASGQVAPAGFAAGVLDSVRGMPARSELVEQVREEEAVGDAVTFSRRIAMAAAVLFGIGVLIGAKVLLTTDTDEIQASQAQMRKLDERVKAMRVEDLRRKQGR